MAYKGRSSKLAVEIAILQVGLEQVVNMANTPNVTKIWLTDFIDFREILPNISSSRIISTDNFVSERLLMPHPNWRVSFDIFRVQEAMSRHV